MCEAIVRESDGIDLGDERLNKRSKLVINYYASRWVIETFFRTLKTGCQVEQILLETLPRVENAAWFKVR